MIRLVLLGCALLALAGCGSSTPPSQADDAAKAAAPAPAQRQKTVFDDQLKALDKAKGVEQQLQKEKEQQDRAIEEQEKGG